MIASIDQTIEDHMHLGNFKYLPQIMQKLIVASALDQSDGDSSFVVNMLLPTGLSHKRQMRLITEAIRNHLSGGTN